MGRNASFSARIRRRPSIHSRMAWIVTLVALPLSLVAAVPTAAQPASGPPGPPGATRFVVNVRDFAPVASAQQYAGLPIERRSEQLRLIAVYTKDSQALFALAQADPNVISVEESPWYEIDIPPASTLGAGESSPSSDPEQGAPSYTPDDVRFSTQYGPKQIGAPYAWDYTRGDHTEAAVCIVDTGVRRSHEDIGTTRWKNWVDYVYGATIPHDIDGHGTYVTGIAAATINNTVGIAGIGNVGIYAAQVFYVDSDGQVWATQDAIADGITWCANRTMDRVVINLSLGIPRTASIIWALTNSISYAYDTKGRLIVAAAGNGSNGSSCNDCVNYPARFSKVIAVSATNSGRGELLPRSRGPEVELTAPGSNIWSTYDTSDVSYAQLSGSSMAAPHVAGALALKWSLASSFTNVTLRNRAKNTAEPIGDPGFDESFGYGEVDAKCIVHTGPYPPQNVAAEPGSASGEIDLSWLGPQWNCGDYVDGYVISRSTSEGGTYSQVASLGASARSWTDTGRTLLTPYWYRVRATNSTGSGPYVTVCSLPYPSVGSC